MIPEAGLMFSLFFVGLLGLAAYAVLRRPPGAGGGSVPDDDMEATMVNAVTISTAGSVTI